jgi:hypothetical protein
MEMEEIIVDPSQPRFGIATPEEKQPEVRLTAAGLPRKKPGRKPGSTLKPKNPDDPPKVRKPRKPRDPNAPPIQRKRKTAPTEDEPSPPADSKSLASSASAPRQSKISDLMDLTTASRSPSAQHDQPQKAPKREEYPRSMQSILNSDPEPTPAKDTPTQPARSIGQNYDPIRGGNYDPIRGTFSGTTSPRPTQATNRPSASPSIASLVDPTHNSHIVSPTLQSYQKTPAQARDSAPTSPSFPHRPAPASATKQSPIETTKQAPNTGSAFKAESKAKDAATVSKKTSPQQKPKKTATAGSSPKMAPLENYTAIAESGRSILDFGKAEPGTEYQAPSIVLHIPLKAGETNKYVNFMRMAEDSYGWDALHPRLAAQRDRKARIAAASAALEKVASGQESGDEMSDDSDKEASNVEMGGMTSGQEAEKPKKKKRNFKEDEYDKDDDFVDDSEMLWEEKAAASSEGFFVYSGPLVAEPEKPAHNA